MGKMSYLPMQFGYFVGAHPLLVIAATMLLCGPILSIFIMEPLVIETDIRRGFASSGGRSVQEFQRFAEFYNVSWLDFELLAVLIRAKDRDQTALKITPELCDEVQRLELFVKSFTVDDNDGQPIRYSDFEVPGGNINYFFNAFKIAYDLQNFATNNGTDGPIILSYPHASVYEHVIPLSSHFFGAEVVENFKEKGLATAMKSVKVIALFYMVQAHSTIEKQRLRRWQMELFRISGTGNFSELFKFYVYGDQVADAEMEQGNLITAKLLVVGVVLIILYMTYALRSFTFKSKIFLIFAAIMSPLLATAISFAIIKWFNVKISSIMCLTPLLMLGIGVDDAFLLMHSWQHQSSMPDAPKRMAVVVIEAGPSVTITSVTNVLAFGIGAFAPSPMMSLFCLCTSLAVGLDYFLELTIFAPTLVLTSRWERKTNVELHEKKPPWYSSSFWVPYARFIVSKTGRLSSIGILTILYIVSGIGVARMTANFDPSKTFPSDSRLIDAVKSVDFVYREYAPVNIVINKVPDISNLVIYGNFMELVSKLESLPEAYGSNRTLLWLRDYVKFLRKNGKTQAEVVGLSYQNIPQFLDNKLMADKNVVRYHFDDRLLKEDYNGNRPFSGSVIVDSFVFAIIFRGSDGWAQRAGLADRHTLRLILQCRPCFGRAYHAERSRLTLKRTIPKYISDRIRVILDKYPQYNATLFDYDATIFDLILTVKHEIIKAAGITLACMTFICFIFMSNLISVTIASLVIFSIFYCLMGLLSLWGLDMDPITMVDVLMAIGLSVDFSAHICYHFHHYDDSAHVHNECSDLVVRKVANIFHVVGTPIFEAGISTILCMLPLFAIPVYSVVAFAKTVVLVALLGIFHGIVVLPALLSLRRRTTTGSTGTGGLKGKIFEPSTINRTTECEHAPMI